MIQTMAGNDCSTTKNELVDYTTVRIPTKFLEKMVDPFVADTAYGFSSRTDAIKAAIRDYFKKFNIQPVQEKSDEE